MRRNYSICEPGHHRAAAGGGEAAAGGVFSSYAMERLRVGDTIEVLTPTGSFCTPLDPAQARHYGAVAAGSGITPILSILATALEVEPASRATLITPTGPAPASCSWRSWRTSRTATWTASS